MPKATDKFISGNLAARREDYVTDQEMAQL